MDTLPGLVCELGQLGLQHHGIDLKIVRSLRFLFVCWILESHNFLKVRHCAGGKRVFLVQGVSVEEGRRDLGLFVRLELDERLARRILTVIVVELNIIFRNSEVTLSEEFHEQGQQFRGLLLVADGQIVD